MSVRACPRSQVKRMHKIGRPVLIGTTSVEKSEIVAELLDEEGIPYEVSGRGIPITHTRSIPSTQTFAK
jgi:hypothetical protein